MVEKHILTVLLVTLLFSNCRKADELQLAKVDYSGSELKINGYYIGESRFDEESSEIFFFYRNGVLLYGTSYKNTTPIEDIENNYSSEEYNDGIKKSRAGWGVFNISNDELDFELWAAGSGGPSKTVVRFCNILNDTTFVATELLNNYNGVTSVLNDTFRFKQFSPKPDSTNMFVQ